MAFITDRIFVSSAAFGQSSIHELLRRTEAMGMLRLELSAGIMPEAGMGDILAAAANERGFTFRVHNYFPPPKVPFVLNLASEDEEVLSASLELCRQAIGLCARLGIPHYSVHAGFCFHARPEDLGTPLTRLPRFSRAAALETFVASLRTLADEAARFELDLLVENNVLAGFNMVDGENPLLLGVTARDLLNMISWVDRPNLGLLLDFGHLKVTAATLGLNPASQAHEMAAHVRAVHLSDNDGKRDSNEPVRNNSWFWGLLQDMPWKGVDFVLEFNATYCNTVQDQVNTLSTFLKHQDVQ